MNEWARFYERLFNFREIRYFDIEGKLTGVKSRAMTSPCGKIRIPINESAGEEGQIQEYLEAYRGEGIQHIALASADIYRTVDLLVERGLNLMDTAETYYELLDARLPGHGEPLEALRKRKILIDGGPEGGLLLQIFTRNTGGTDLLRDHPAQGRRRIRCRQLQGAVRIDGTRPDSPQETCRSGEVSATARRPPFLTMESLMAGSLTLHGNRARPVSPRPEPDKRSTMSASVLFEPF